MHLPFVLFSALPFQFCNSPYSICIWIIQSFVFSGFTPYSDFVLGSHTGGSCCFSFCSSKNLFPSAVPIFTVSVRNLWDSALHLDLRAVGGPERSHITCLHPSSHCSSYVSQHVCSMGLNPKILSKAWGTNVLSLTYLWRCLRNLWEISSKLSEAAPEIFQYYFAALFSGLIPI